jgi:hypothetical protein
MNECSQIALGIAFRLTPLASQTSPIDPTVAQPFSGLLSVTYVNVTGNLW